MRDQSVSPGEELARALLQHHVRTYGGPRGTGVASLAGSFRSYANGSDPDRFCARNGPEVYVGATLISSWTRVGSDDRHVIAEIDAGQIAVWWRWGEPEPFVFSLAEIVAEAFAGDVLQSSLL